MVVSDLMANFSCMDELIQVIYQSIYKFVVLSTVSNSAWNIHVGLNGEQGRWWHGSWTEADIRRIFGPHPSDKLLEAAAEKIAEAFIQGEMCISDWSAEKGAKIKLTLSSATKKLVDIDLVELSAEDAAAHAASVFIDIALQAQSRKCRLYPSFTNFSALDGQSLSAFKTSRTTLPLKRKGLEPSDSGHANFASDANSKTPVLTKPESTISAAAQVALEEIKTLKSQLEQVKRKDIQAKEAIVPPTARSHKGASLANPNKKARKYQALEFDDG